MERLKVKTSDLIAVLKINRQKHVLEYKEAVRQYRLRAAEALNRELQKCLAGKKFETSLGISRPISHEKDYDLIIKMLEMSVEDTTILTHGEFTQFVMDEWNWKSNFIHTAYNQYGGYYGTSGCTGTSGSSGTSGTSGSSGRSLVVEDDDLKTETYVTINFSGDELYGKYELEILEGKTEGTSGVAGEYVGT